MQVMAQSPQVQPLLCMARKANTADADLEMRGGALVKMSETSLAAAPGQRNAGDAARSSAALSSSLHPQLFHTIDRTLLEPASSTSRCRCREEDSRSHTVLNACVRRDGEGAVGRHWTEK